MPTGKRRKLDSTVAAIQQRHGAHAIRKASDLATPAPPPAIPTGCQGMPLGALTLLSGRTTSGKTTLTVSTVQPIH
ncbi:MAG TPA: hypothetical protein PKE45_12850 [Caldilineaceae bacterium]|nr:hypothetical protein [Caldilineaceae bacterium]